MLVADSANSGPEVTGSLRTMPHVEGASEGTGFDDAFRASIGAGMTMVLGPDGTKATLYHLDLHSLDSPRMFHDKLTAIFGAGAQSLERVILQQLHRALGVGLPSWKDDFVSQVEHARSRFDAVAKPDRRHQ